LAIGGYFGTTFFVAKALSDPARYVDLTFYDKAFPR